MFTRPYLRTFAKSWGTYQDGTAAHDTAQERFGVKANYPAWCKANSLPEYVMEDGKPWYNVEALEGFFVMCEALGAMKR